MDDAKKKQVLRNRLNIEHKKRCAEGLNYSRAAAKASVAKKRIQKSLSITFRLVQQLQELDEGDQ